MSDLVTASAALVAAALQASKDEQGDPTENFYDHLATLIVQTAATVEALTAATTAPAKDKRPITVRGLITSVDGNKVTWTDLDNEAKERQAFVGPDPISRHAARRAASLIGEKAWVSIGWVRGEGAHGEADIRRLIRVTT